MILGEPPPPSDLKRAQDRSKGCPECSGCGLTSRTIDRDLGDGEVTSYRAACYCHRCEAGRELKAHHGQHCSEMRGRIIDLSLAPDLQPSDYDLMPLGEREKHLSEFRSFNLARKLGQPLAKSAPAARKQPIPKVHSEG